MSDIIYTKVDEAPELASASFLPIIQKFASAAGVTVGTKDISLAAKHLGICSAIGCRRERVTRQGLRPARLSRSASHRRGKRDPRPL